MKTSKRFMFGVLAAVATVSALEVAASVPAAVTGAWYNPSQSGHGVTVQVLNPQRALLFWHAFDNNGDPLTLYIEGDISGRQIRGTAYAPNGMRFGEFDPSDLQLPVWGEVTLSFDSCHEAQLSWHPQQAGFSAGQMRLERLAAVAPAICDLPAPNDLPTGLYQGVTEPGPYDSFRAEGIGVVDAEGRLWAMEIFHPDVAPAGEIPGPNWQNLVSGRSPPYEFLPLVGLSLPQADGSAATALAQNHALIDAEQHVGQSRPQATWNAQGVSIGPYSNGRHQRWTPASGSQSLRDPLRRADLVGTYRLPFDANHDSGPGRMTIDASGTLCLQTHVETGADCIYRGQTWLPDGELGLFDFELQRRDGKLVRELKGRGWVVDGPHGRLLYMVAIAPTGALGLVAY